MNIICLICSREMVKQENGIKVSNYTPTSVVPKIYRGDLFECPQCHHQVVSSFGNSYESKNKENIVWVK